MVIFVQQERVGDRDPSPRCRSPSSAFAIIHLNYSLDNLSMMALILSVGFVVGTIVMLENYRHVEMGEDPSGLLVGSRESARSCR
jgi:hypothetical protein